MEIDGLRRDRDRVIEALRAVDLGRIAALRGRFLEALREDRTLLFFGNGGSAALASHFAQDMGKGALPRPEWPRRFRSISLADAVPYITAFGNDEGYESIFLEQLKGLARPGDVTVAISGSGRSANVIRATEWANANGLFTVGFTGFDGGELARIVRLSIHVPLEDMETVESVHAALEHMVVADVRRALAAGA